MFWRAIIISSLCHGVLLTLATVHWQLHPESLVSIKGQGPLSVLRLPPVNSLPPPVSSVAAQSGVAGPGHRLEKPRRQEARRADGPGQAQGVNSAGVSVAIPSAQAASVSLDAESLRRYRLNLAQEARRLRQRANFDREGVVVLELLAGVGVGAPIVSLSQSSGIREMDVAAQQMLTQVIDSVPLPEALRLEAFRLSIPIHYSRGE